MKFREIIEKPVQLVNEGVDYYDAIVNAMDAGDRKFDQALWDKLEVLGSEKGIYAGDATPDDILDALSDKELKAVYTELSKKFKKIMTESINEGWSKPKPNMGLSGAITIDSGAISIGYNSYDKEWFGFVNDEDGDFRVQAKGWEYGMGGAWESYDLSLKQIVKDLEKHFEAKIDKKALMGLTYKVAMGQ